MHFRSVFDRLMLSARLKLKLKQKTEINNFVSDGLE